MSQSDSIPPNLTGQLESPGPAGEENSVGVLGNLVDVPGGYQVTNGRLAITQTYRNQTTTLIFNITGNAYAIVRQRDPRGRISVTFGSAGY